MPGTSNAPKASSRSNTPMVDGSPPLGGRYVIHLLCVSIVKLYIVCIYDVISFICCL